MANSLDIIEKKITDFWTDFFRRILFFLKDDHQSLFVSFLHYIVFILGLIYFFFYSHAGDLYRILFFCFALLGALSYFIFNRCIFTSIEINLSDKKNNIQKVIDKYFGKEIEGNITSKFVLSLFSIITGISLLKDYGLLNQTEL
jgi:flagellar biosynthesis protein FlhB